MLLMQLKFENPWCRGLSFHVEIIVNAKEQKKELFCLRNSKEVKGGCRGVTEEERAVIIGR